MNRDRGEYRSLYVAFWDDPDVHALSDLAYRVLTTLKGTLGPAGIGVVYLSQLAEQCGRDGTADIRQALAELERAPYEGAAGWIRREGNIVWLVNGLHYEPMISPVNWKHRQYVQEKLLAPLGDKAIVRAFWARYPEWRPEGTPTATDSHPDTLSNGYPMASEGQSDHKNKHKHSPKTELNSERAAETAPLSPASSLARATADFLATCYAGANEMRVERVERDLRLARGVGVVLRGGQLAKADSDATLERALAMTIADVRAGKVRDPDKAIVWALRKLLDTANEPRDPERPRLTVTEAASERVAEEDRKAVAAARENLKRATRWLDARPSERERIQAHLVALFASKAGHALTLEDLTGSVIWRPLYEASLVDAVREAQRSERQAKEAGDMDPEPAEVSA